MRFTYKGLKAQYSKYTVTDEDVDRQLQRLLQQNPRIAEVTDRPTELGDEVVLDYAGFCDGVQFPGGTAEKQTLVLGSGMFIPGFEEQLLDKVPGEEVSVKVTFPTVYHSEELAGKEAEFKCKLHAIRVKTPYELDDTFAKEIGGCENLAEMRQRMQESMQAYADERGEMEMQDQLVRQAAETLEMVISEEQLNDAIAEQMQVLQAQLARQNLSIEMYCSFMGKTEADLREEALPAAEASVKVQAAINRIVELENLEATKEEIGEALALIARQNGMTVEQLQQMYDAEMEKAVIRSVLTTKAMQLIRDAAVIEEV
jgi:trigger factor